MTRAAASVLLIGVLAGLTISTAHAQKTPFTASADQSTLRPSRQLDRLWDSGVLPHDIRRR